ncbi:MAG: hypothetical protein IT430_05725 [Phycisphaerales bacterium]|nr:hypothetical protein [Phycisphaerales bacterium]
MTRRLNLTALAAALLAGAAHAQTVIDPSRVQLVEPVGVQEIYVGGQSPAYGITVYDNSVNFNLRTYAPGQANVEMADDLHMDRGGNIVSLHFAYYHGFVGGGTITATVTVYDNDPANSVYPGNGANLLATYVIPNLPKRAISLIGVRFDPPEPLPVPQDVWMGVSFDSSNTYAVLCHPPVVGTSEDIFSQNPPGGLYYFSGNPPANFWWAVQMDGPGVLVQNPPSPGRAGVNNTLSVYGAQPGHEVFFAYALREGQTPVPGCPEVVIFLQQPTIIGSAIADGNGEASLSVFVPGAARGVTVILQALDRAACSESNAIFHRFE